MYIHLGENTVISVRKIITIIDMETTTVSKITKAFLRNAEELGQVINVTNELPKSAVICEEYGLRTIYISQISATTLQKRAGSILQMEGF